MPGGFRMIAEMMLFNFQNESRHAVLACGERELEHPVWGGPGWKVYLEDLDDFERTLSYVQNNPVKDACPVQVHPFVTPYDGWMPGKVTRLKPTSRNRERDGCR